MSILELVFFYGYDLSSLTIQQQQRVLIEYEKLLKSSIYINKKSSSLQGGSGGEEQFPSCYVSPHTPIDSPPPSQQQQDYHNNLLQEYNSSERNIQSPSSPPLLLIPQQPTSNNNNYIITPVNSPSPSTREHLELSQHQEELSHITNEIYEPPLELNPIDNIQDILIKKQDIINNVESNIINRVNQLDELEHEVLKRREERVKQLIDQRIDREDDGNNKIVGKNVNKHVKRSLDEIVDEKIEKKSRLSDNEENEGNNLQALKKDYSYEYQYAIEDSLAYHRFTNDSSNNSLNNSPKNSPANNFPSDNSNSPPGNNSSPNNKSSKSNSPTSNIPDNTKIYYVPPMGLYRNYYGCNSSSRFPYLYHFRFSHHDQPYVLDLDLMSKVELLAKEKESDVKAFFKQQCGIEDDVIDLKLKPRWMTAMYFSMEIFVKEGDGADKECKIDNAPIDVSLSVFIALGMLISYLPQVHRIISHKTSEGLSPWFLLLGTTSATCSLFNILLLQYEMIDCCYDPKVSGYDCFANTLGIIQLIIQWTMFTTIFLLYMLYFPPQRKLTPYIRHIHFNSPPTTYSYEWRASLGVSSIIAVHLIITSVVSLLLLNSGKPEDNQLTKLWADGLGIVSMFLASVQYIPQIYRTWKRKSVGALSIPMMLIQTPGSFLFVYTLAIRPGVRWTTWIVFLVTGSLQGILLVMCICWYYRAKRLGYGPFYVGETDPLINNNNNDRSSDNNSETAGPLII
ncbi:13896_t:CDS:2 [Entrophospora sp. SA101]|nr:13896_t:CDS:2 [Entrophospora sp. SA101]